MAVQFFYDQQIRRFLLQFIRLVSNFQVEFGTTDTHTGKLALQTVPVFYGDQSRQAAHILRPSQNSMSTVPAMAVYISGLSYDRDRVQEPFFLSKVHLRQRKVDPDTGLTTSEEGDSFTVERLMPVPYKLTLKLDIWTSNTEQKLQLIEQLCTVFNPSLELQSTDNYIDWSSLSYVTLTDVTWDSRTVPIGGEDPISVASLTFELPMWISPPAKLKKLGIIDKLVSSFSDGTGLNPTGRTNGGAGLVGTSTVTYADAVGDPDRALTRRAWNLMRYGILYSGNTMQLIKYDETVGNPTDPNDPNPVVHRSGVPDSWGGVLSLYGSIKPGLSEIRIEQSNGSEIIGTIALHPADDTLMLFEPFIDTLPGNTLKPINVIVDPFKVNVDKMLIDRQSGAYKVEAGTRFLITNPINSQDNTEWAIAWSPNGEHFAANANDIIEYDGTYWKVSFDSQRTIEESYVTNLNTNVQYHWDGEGWTKSYEGHYKEGKWTLII
jgi:hypothetical protein